MRSQAELIDAAVAAHVSWMTALANATGGRIWNDDGLVAIHHPLPHNEVLLPFPDRIPRKALARVLTWCGENRVRMVGCWGRDDDAPAPRGFAEGWQPHWMAGCAAGAPDPRVAETGQVPEYDEYGQRLLHGMHGSRHFVARVDGSVAGMAWLHDGALFDVFVHERFRRQGVGTALTRAACTDGQVVLNATAEGEALYRSLGFESLGRGRTWWLRRA